MLEFTVGFQARSHRISCAVALEAQFTNTFYERFTRGASSQNVFFGGRGAFSEIGLWVPS